MLVLKVATQIPLPVSDVTTDKCFFKKHSFIVLPFGRNNSKFLGTPVLKVSDRINCSFAFQKFSENVVSAWWRDGHRGIVLRLVKTD